MQSNLRAITLWRPWPWAIVSLGKDHENRTWECWLRPDEFLAIHAGKGWDKEATGWIAERFGVIAPPKQAHIAGAVVAVARFGGNVRISASQWFAGPVGWKLYDVVEIEPVACQGAQGLWKLPGDVLKQVRAAYQAAQLATT